MSTYSHIHIYTYTYKSDKLSRLNDFNFTDQIDYILGIKKKGKIRKRMEADREPLSVTAPERDRCNVSLWYYSTVLT